MKPRQDEGDAGGLPDGGSESRRGGLLSSDPEPERRIGHVLKERYPLTEVLGNGPLGPVYAAEDLVTKSRVRIEMVAQTHARDGKLLFDDRTAKAARATEGPSSFVSVRDFDLTADGRFFLVTEPVEGKTLADLIHADSPLGLSRALRLAMRVGECLETAQNMGLLGLDIRPQHVMVVGPEEAVKLMGTEALVLQRLGFPVTLTQGSVTDIGAYRAPEEAAGGAVTERADIYRFGVLLHELLTGTVPGSTTRGGRMDPRSGRAAESARVARPALPRAVTEILLRSLESNPEARPDGMSVVLNDLWRAMEPLEKPATSLRSRSHAPAWERGSRDERASWRRLGSARRWLLGLAGLLLVIGGPIWWQGAPKPRAPVPTVNPTPSSPESIPDSPSAPTASADQSTKETPAVVKPPIPPISASTAPKPGGNSTTTRQRDVRPIVTPPPSAPTAVEAPRTRPPVPVVSAPPSAPSRESDSADPAAIIDWLLRERPLRAE